MNTDALTAAALVNVVQLPIIEEQLYIVKSQVEKEVEFALSLVCDTDTIQTVKQTRANMNKQFAELEAVRKNVKAAVMAPYKQFEAVYEECVAAPFKRADGALKGKIDAVETELKQGCEEKLRSYFAECCEAYNVDFLQYEDAGIKVDMTSAKSKTPKKLMEQIRCFVESIAEQMKVIAGFEYADEMMVEFKKSLDGTAAIAAVMNRHKAVEEERTAAEARREVEDRRRETEARTRAYAPAAVEQKQTEELLTVAFTVTDTRARLKALKAFLEANGYDYT